MANRTRSPCGACKFLRRRCDANCVFAPYFCSNQSSTTFATIHKVFGANNFSKILLQLPVHERCVAVNSITIEAQARMEDPIYGCVSHIIALQHQVINLQAQLIQERAQHDQYSVNPRNTGNQWASTTERETLMFRTTDHAYHNMTSSPQYSINNYDNGVFLQQEMYSRDDVVQFPAYETSSYRTAQSDIDELQALALKMTKTESKF